MTADGEKRRPVLEGVIGWVRGEVFPLKGDTNVIGRSRHCDISLRQCDGYLRQAAEERDLDHDFNTVSRRHATITVTGNTVTIEDLSTNGTFCNEVLLTERKTYDLEAESPLLRLGTRESFRISLWPGTGASTDEEGALEPMHRSSLETCDHDAPVPTERAPVPEPSEETADAAAVEAAMADDDDTGENDSPEQTLKNNLE